MPVTQARLPKGDALSRWNRWDELGSRHAAGNSACNFATCRSNKRDYRTDATADIATRKTPDGACEFDHEDLVPREDLVPFLEARTGMPHCFPQHAPAADAAADTTVRRLLAALYWWCGPELWGHRGGRQPHRIYSVHRFVSRIGVEIEIRTREANWIFRQEPLEAWRVGTRPVVVQG